MIAHDNVLYFMIFPMTLGDQAMNWYNALPHHSLYSFEQLVNLFLEQVSINMKKRASVIDLIKLSQLEKEFI